MQTLLTTSSSIMTVAKVIIISSWYLRETFSFCKWMFTFIIYFYLSLSPWWSWVSHSSCNSRYAISIRNWNRKFPNGPVVKSCAFTDKGQGSIPDWGAKILQAMVSQKQQQKRNCEKETMASLCVFPFNYLGILLFSSPVWKFTIFSEKQKTSHLEGKI